MSVQFRQVQWIHRPRKHGVRHQDYMGQIMKELRYFKGFLPTLDAILKMTSGQTLENFLCYEGHLMLQKKTIKKTQLRNLLLVFFSGFCFLYSYMQLLRVMVTFGDTHKDLKPDADSQQLYE